MSESVSESTDSGVVVNIPRFIRNYVYVRTIGSGASSVVVQLEDVRTHALFAGKVVPRSLLSHPQRLQLFERELRLLQSLNHPHICSVEDVIYLPDIILIVMEHCANGDLLTYMIEHKYILPVIKRRMFYELCSAVAYLHSKNLAHRDLKPENVFIDEDLSVKLGDFGLARESEDGEMLTTLCGTLSYSAPEVIMRKDYDGKKADVWSLGIILFCLQVMAMPWTSTNTSEVSEQVINAEIDIPPTVSRQVADVILACMKKNPDDRPTVAEIMKMEWLRDENIRGVKSLDSRVKVGLSGTQVRFAGGRPSNPTLKIPARLMLTSNKSVKQFRTLAKAARRSATRSSGDLSGTASIQ